VVPDGEQLQHKLQRYKSGMLRILDGEMRRYEMQLQGMRRGSLSMSVDRVLREPLQRMLQTEKVMEDAAERGLEQREQQVILMKQRYATVHPELLIDGRLEKVGHCKQLLEQILGKRLEKMEQAVLRQKSMLRALGPDSAFERGFSITMTSDGKLVRSVDAVESGVTLVTKLSDGELVSVVSGK